ncbi:sodium-coupled monocarboxylate transporter 1-like [Teleopsis dalmanni]|uniref:sodium-coupled monocarboxylate transporter 1-like n=1 Tax=Teleopsis dalmanni TaxID=139649 RepID=UPI0018CC8CF9|nr:sodium-coupled monocarboxylate transporter 1-like [Teleopsis dalmanni]
MGTESSSAVAAAMEHNTPANKMNVADLSASLQHFGFVDYFVFVLMLLVCAVIGFYFGFVEKKKKRNMEERGGTEALNYLVGGRKMKVFPVSMSLVASFVSGISLLGISTEIYIYGTQYAFALMTLVLTGVIIWYLFLPVFCNLQLTSTYEYLEMRFDKRVRLLGSVFFFIEITLWLPIVILVPALAFNQVTGVNIHIVTTVVCIVCIFYTCVGGVKAVIWTDVIQTVIMVGAIILVIIKGTSDVGGLGVVLKRNYDSGRIEIPTITLDPTERLSMLSIILGATFLYVEITVNQVFIQRFLSLPGAKEAKHALILYIIGVIILLLGCAYNGLLIYATYHDCDPLTTNLAKAKDQIVPLLVMDILSDYPGTAGLFVAGVFSAALSSLSTGLNSLSAVFLEDFIKTFRKSPLTEHQTAIIMRVSVVVMGVICVGLVFVIENLGTVLELSISIGTMTSGPLLGLFLMGVLMPWINGKSVLLGSVAAYVAMSWICIKGKIALTSGELIYPMKPFSTEGCTYKFEELITPANQTVVLQSDKTLAQYIYQMSFMLYVTVGAILSIIFSHIASLVFGCNDPKKMNIELFSPLIRKYIKPMEYESVQIEEQNVLLNTEKKIY